MDSHRSGSSLYDLHSSAGRAMAPAPHFSQPVPSFAHGTPNAQLHNHYGAPSGYSSSSGNLGASGAPGAGSGSTPDNQQKRDKDSIYG